MQTREQHVLLRFSHRDLATTGTTVELYTSLDYYPSSEPAL